MATEAGCLLKAQGSELPGIKTCLFAQQAFGREAERRCIAEKVSRAGSSRTLQLRQIHRAFFQGSGLLSGPLQSLLPK